ncbi:MAG: phosphomannomutase/phosphoglucomutase [Alphaproteobacteria bacterium]|nr:phosphomannomutase/phosphoglucomutase [Alphaproteobacteria bacterium]
MDFSNKHLFKTEILREYDIRGTVGKNLSENDAYKLGLCFAEFMTSQGLKTIAIGRDGRLTSPALSEALASGLVQGGVHVHDVGIGPTPMVYFAIKDLTVDAGIMVTGSHNPSDDNGFKMALHNRPFFGKDIQNLATLEGKIAETPGSCQTIEIEQKYINRVLKDYNSDKRRLKIAWDPGNGAAGRVIDVLTKPGILDVDSIVINGAIDGTFPAHHPDPTVPENLKQLIAVVQENDCDAGIAFDGDADRIGVVDGKGRILWGDQLMILWSRAVLKTHPGATIIADVKASQVLFDDITNHGGNALMGRTGHSLIKSMIAETGAVLAGEMSGHIFFADHYYGYDDAIYAAIRLINILHDSDQTLSELFDHIPKRFNTPEIRISCDDSQKFSVVEKIAQALQKDGATVNAIDGVRVTGPHGWWLLRASNTQAKLVARCESESAEGLERLQQQLASYLEPFGVHVD